MQSSNPTLATIIPVFVRLRAEWLRRRDGGWWRRTRGRGWIEREMDIKMIILLFPDLHERPTITCVNWLSRVGKQSSAPAPAYARRPDQWYSRPKTAKGFSTWLLDSCIKNEVPTSLTGRRSTGRLGKSFNRSTTVSAEGRSVGFWVQQSWMRCFISALKPRCRPKSSAGRDGLFPLRRRSGNSWSSTPSNGIWPENI